MRLLLLPKYIQDVIRLGCLIWCRLGLSTAQEKEVHRDCKRHRWPSQYERRGRTKDGVCLT